jgi:hypothetical protein
MFAAIGIDPNEADEFAISSEIRDSAPEIANDILMSTMPNSISQNDHAILKD